MGRKGPGLLLKDIMSGDDQQIISLVKIIQTVRPDILLLNEFDTDFNSLALTEFSRALAQGETGIDYPYMFAPTGNEGQPSFLDLDGDGRMYRWSDNYGFGRFPGSEGMALLSKYPIETGTIRTFAELEWMGLVDGPIPAPPKGLLDDETLAKLRLSSRSHWDVRIILPNDEGLHVLASSPTPPVFDGEKDLNGLRNEAEIGFWVAYLDGRSFTDDTGLDAPFAGGGFVIMGDLNNDPVDGEGRNGALRRLLSHPLVYDPQPRSIGAGQSASRLQGANVLQMGETALDTVEWDADIGNMRVDYVLPSASIPVIAAEVFWPDIDDPMMEHIGEGREGASNHRLVWVDLEIR